MSQDPLSSFFFQVDASYSLASVVYVVGKLERWRVQQTPDSMLNIFSVISGMITCKCKLGCL